MCVRAALPWLLVLAFAGCDAIVDRATLRFWDWADEAPLDDGSLHVVLVGTGVPIPDPERLNASTAIMAAGELLLVDAGAGTIRQADVMGLPIRRLTTVLVTHFHSDHIGGLGETVAHTWFRGRSGRLAIHGPPGLARVVRGFQEAYAFDTAYRALPGGDELDPSLQTSDVHEVTVGAGDESVVLERNGLRVVAFAVDHRPVAPAYGYRIEYAGRSVVLSGDTRAYPQLALHARGADLLIHSAGVLPPDFAVESFRRLQDRHRVPRADLDLFATPTEVARVAADAGVAKLVFSHIPPLPDAARPLWLRGVADLYAGPVVVGEDGLHFELPPKN